MTVYTFSDNMINSYRCKDERVNEVFRDDLNIFCDKVGENANYQPIYDHIKMEHKSWDKPPMMAMFYQAAKDNNLLSNYHEEFRGWYVCKICKTKYSIQSGACPACKSTDSSVTKWESDQSFPSDVKFVQESCFQCNLYKPDSISNGDRVYGCTCGSYGNFYAKMAIRECNNCKCRQCCVMKAREKHDPSYEDDLKHGRIKEGWIK